MMQAPESKVDLILAQFPWPVTLYPSRKKWLLLLLGGGLFTYGGYSMVSSAEPWGWSVLIFFAAGMIISIVMLLPGASGVTLDADGFQVTSLYRRHRSRWRNVTSFVPVSIPYSRQKLVAFDDATITGGIAQMSVDISGHNAALPDSYGFSVDDLAALMTRWRDRAVT
jgi:hypothetical protein